MKHLLVTSLALVLGVFVGFGISYTMQEPETAPVLRNTVPTSGAQGDPVVIFEPNGLFTQEEQERLTRDVVQPMTIYHQTSGSPIVSILLHTTPGARALSVETVHQNGGYTAFTQDPREPWVPDCFFPDCGGIPQEFKTLYPQLFQKALEQN